MKKLALIGAGSHSDAIFSMINFSTYKIVGYFDDKDIVEYNSFPILGTIEQSKEFLARGEIDNVFISIGDNDKRKEIFDFLKENHYEQMINIIAPTATVLNVDAIQGKNIFVGHMVFLGAEVIVNDNSIVNTCSVVEHHTQIGMHCNVAPNSTMNGLIKLGNNCYLGSSATVIQAIEICDDVFIGASATVTKNIDKPGLYVGTPAKFLREL